MHTCQDITSHCFPDKVLKTQVHPPLRMCLGIHSKETSAGSEAVTPTKLARLNKEEKQHQHFYFAKGNLFYAAQTQAMTFQFPWELPAKLHHQQSMQFRTRSGFGTGSATQKCFLLNSLFSRGEALRSQEHPWL